MVELFIPTFTATVKNPKTAEEKLSALRKLMIDSDVDSLLVTIADEFLLEEPLPFNNRIKWLTSFSGSFAMLLITHHKAYFFTDSRYLIQAEIEIPGVYVILRYNPTEVRRVLEKENIRSISYDAKVTNYHVLKLFSCSLKPLNENLIDLIWLREEARKERILAHPLCYAGLTTHEKCRQVAAVIGGNNYFFSNSESVCWLANIRGFDLKYTPVACCRAILYSNGLLRVFLHAHVDELPSLEGSLEVFRLEELEHHLAELESVGLDLHEVSTYYINLIGKEKIVHSQDPSIIMRACKNSVELKGSIAAHKRDGVAVTKFLNWLKSHQDSNELEAADVLLNLRKEQDLFFSLSFPTISAFGPSGAIVHYHPSRKSNRSFHPGGLYLVDSGAQYLDGTTDVTRTVAIGHPTEEQKFHYTVVLKAHIALAKAVFPVGTTGRQLDALARSELWRYKLDYAHGTGHGAGSFLNVHEGPHSFSNEVPLQVGMIISNEPGLYFENNYGIRIENLMYVKESGNRFLAFTPLTLVEFDDNLILPKMLSKEELKWLEEYSNLVEANLLSPS